MKSLDIEFLRSIIQYDPLTGALRWKARPLSMFSGNGRWSAEHEMKWWNAKYAGKEAGKRNGESHVFVKIKGSMFSGHRIAWAIFYGEWPCVDVDHIDLNRRNNRIDNLRLASRSQNCANKGPQSNNSSGYKGVGFSKRENKWVAHIMVRRRGKHLGYFEKIEDAADAYRRAALHYFGEFARF